MNLRAFLILSGLAILSLFALVNWGSFTTPTNLNLLVARIDAPLGLLMLIVVGALTVVFLLMVARVEIAALLESKRTVKELDAARRVAESSEASRLEGLRQHLDRELAALNVKLDALLQKQERTGGGPAA